MNMNYVSIFFGLAAFFVFACLQAMFINGVKSAMDDGDILSGFSKFIEKNVKSEFIKKPIISCVKCMSSLYGALTFWPFVICVFGFHWSEVPLFIADVFILVFLNFYFYKRS